MIRYVGHTLYYVVHIIFIQGILIEFYYKILSRKYFSNTD